MTNGAYRLPPIVCAFGLPKYTPTEGPPCSRITAPRRSATTPYASSQLASVSTPSRRTRGWLNRSGSLSSSAKLAPFGQMKPLLKTSSRSPRAPVTRPSEMVSVRPQVASQRGQIRKAVLVSDIPASCPCYWRRVNSGLAVAGGIAADLVGRRDVKSPGATVLPQCDERGRGRRQLATSPPGHTHLCVQRRTTHTQQVEVVAGACVGLREHRNPEAED